MNKKIFKFVSTENDVTIFEMKGGQFCNPRVYSGWKNKVIQFLANRYFNRN